MCHWLCYLLLHEAVLEMVVIELHPLESVPNHSPQSMDPESRFCARKIWHALLLFYFFEDKKKKSKLGYMDTQEPRRSERLKLKRSLSAIHDSAYEPKSKRLRKHDVAPGRFNEDQILLDVFHSDEEENESETRHSVLQPVKYKRTSSSSKPHLTKWRRRKSNFVQKGKFF